MSESHIFKASVHKAHTVTITIVFMGLTGSVLVRAHICLITIPGFLLFSYNQSSISSIPDYPSFIKYFLDIYTRTSTSAFKACNATTQRKLAKFEAYPLQ